eukprot:RCo029251
MDCCQKHIEKIAALERELQDHKRACEEWKARYFNLLHRSLSSCGSFSESAECKMDLGDVKPPSETPPFKEHTTAGGREPLPNPDVKAKDTCDDSENLSSSSLSSVPTMPECPLGCDADFPKTDFTHQPKTPLPQQSEHKRSPKTEVSDVKVTAAKKTKSLRFAKPLVSSVEILEDQKEKEEEDLGIPLPPARKPAPKPVKRSIDTQDMEELERILSEFAVAHQSDESGAVSAPVSTKESRKAKMRDLKLQKERQQVEKFDRAISEVQQHRREQLQKLLQLHKLQKLQDLQNALRATVREAVKPFAAAPAGRAASGQAPPDAAGRR